MIRLTWGQIREPQFSELYDRINHTKMPVAFAKKIGKITEALKLEFARLQPIWNGLVKDYLEELPGTQGAIMRVREELPEDEKNKAMSELTEFAQTVVEINLDPIRLEDLVDFHLTPIELVRLKGLIDGDETSN